MRKHKSISVFTVITCPRPTAPMHGAVSCTRSGQSRPTISRQPFDTACSYTCNNGYTLSGSASRTCLVSGSWDGSNTLCTDVTAPVLECPSDMVFFAAEGQSRVSIQWDWEPVVVSLDRGQSSSSQTRIASTTSSKYSTPIWQTRTTCGGGVNFKIALSVFNSPGQASPTTQLFRTSFLSKLSKIHVRF